MREIIIHEPGNGKINHTEPSCRLDAIKVFCEHMLFEKKKLINTKNNF